MRVLIVGARADGQAHVVLDALEEGGEHEAVAFADETPELAGQTVLGLPVLGDPEEVLGRVRELGISGAVMAVGDIRARVRLAELCRRAGLVLPAIVHPAGQVSRHARLGEGVFVGQGAQVAAGAQVGELTQIQAGAVVSHHVRVGRANLLGPNCTLAGRSSTGDFVFLGAGCVVLPEVHVGEGTVVGAGAVVTRDAPPDAVMVGVPARPQGR